MQIDVIKLAEILTAILAIGGVLWAIFKWVSKLNKLCDEMKSVKEENALTYYALHACLDGLEQLGANHTVPVAKEKLEKYLNIQAHQ